MKRYSLAIVGLVVAAIILVPAAVVYAMDYSGEYEVRVSMTITSEVYAQAAASDVVVEADEMGLMSFWSLTYDALKGHPPASVIANFTVFCELIQGSDTDTQRQSSIVCYPSGAEDMTFTFYEKKAGETEVHVYIEHVYTNTVVFDYTWEVNIS